LCLLLAWGGSKSILHRAVPRLPQLGRRAAYTRSRDAFRRIAAGVESSTPPYATVDRAGIAPATTLGFFDAEPSVERCAVGKLQIEMVPKDENQRSVVEYLQRYGCTLFQRSQTSGHPVEFDGRLVCSFEASGVYLDVGHVVAYLVSQEDLVVGGKVKVLPSSTALLLLTILISACRLAGNTAPQILDDFRTATKFRSIQQANQTISANAVTPKSLPRNIGGLRVRAPIPARLRMRSHGGML
jgi:hypothetical protein